MANIRKQRNVAKVLSAAGMPVDDKLVNYSHLQYLPSSFYQSGAILSLTMLPPDKLVSQEIFRAIRLHIQHRPRQKRCYYHNSIPVVMISWIVALSNGS